MNRKTKILIILNLVVLFLVVFWHVVNPYKHELTGTFFELTWLPTVLTLFLLPVVTIYSWYKINFSFRTVYLALLLLSAATLILFFTLK